MHNVARRVKCVPNLGSVLASLPDSHASLCHAVSPPPPPPPFPGNEAESVFHLCGIITAVLLSSVCVGLISSQHSWSVVFSQLWRSVLHYCVVCYITSYLIHRRGTFVHLIVIAPHTNKNILTAKISYASVVILMMSGHILSSHDLPMTSLIVGVAESSSGPLPSSPQDQRSHT